MPLGFSQKKVFALGLKDTGLAAIAALQTDGAIVHGWDDNPEQRRAAREKFPHLTLTDTPDWQTIAALVRAPGFKLSHPLIQQASAHNVPVMGDMDLLWRRQHGKGNVFIGITGTNGKSTTTSLIAHVLKQAGHVVAAGGNLSPPAIALPDLPTGGIYVLEISSYQLLTTHELTLNAAVFLNLTADHLDIHGTLENYRDAKLRIFSRMAEPAVKVLGVDQPILQREAEKLKNINTLSTTAQAADYTVNAAGELFEKGVKIADLSTLTNLPGPHNWQNMACAFVALKPWVSADVFVQHARTFAPLPHRMEPVGEHQGVRYINDSKATNADSSIWALKSFENIYWIIGGVAKADGIAPCIPHMQNVKAVFAIGEAAENFMATLAPVMATTHSRTIEQAITQATRAAQQAGGGVVLFSPACASFDQFKNYQHRGDVFRELVHTMAQTKAAS